MIDVPLKEPLSLFGVRGVSQSHDARAARIHVFHEALNGASLTCGVTALKKDDYLLALFLHVLLQFQKLNLKPVELFFVKVVVVAVRIGISAFSGLRDQIVHVLENFARFFKPFGSLPRNEVTQDLIARLRRKARGDCLCECRGLSGEPRPREAL